mmetsp:Transcript_10382/g.26984  ORF Transcript_10382/g.26984 Transcript_10382/m.26984 type:complete len:217 (-) Transcript_10382:239-889(-)
MLYADKNALRTNLKVNLLRIRERELTFYTNNCLSISTQAALLAGFAWFGLTEVPWEADANEYVQAVYLVVTTLIMGLQMLTVVNATLVAILGPGLALRGPDGSMHTAVDGMMTHYRFTFASFSLGLVCFQFSALLYHWMQFTWGAMSSRRPVMGYRPQLLTCPRPCPPIPSEFAVPNSMLLLTTVWLMWRGGRRIYALLKLSADTIVTGEFDGNID